MSVSLQDALPNRAGRQGGRVWLKSSGYARRLLLGDSGDPWIAAAAYLAFFAQAHGLLHPDVAVIDVGDLYRSWVGRHPDLAADMAARRRATVPLRKMLDDPAPRQMLNEVVEAVLAHLRGRTPLVLSLPSPQAWVGDALALAGLTDVAVDADAAEDAAMYIADLLRSVSGHAIGGVLFEEPAGSPITVAGLAAYRPLLNIAAHYRWAASVRGSFAPDVTADALAEFAAIIADAPVEYEPVGAVGRNVSAALWSGAALPALPPGGFYFAEIPVAHQPEAVLEALARLR